MSRATRITAAVVLAVGFAGVPLVADWCAVMCETVHASAVPSCHHTSSSTPQVARTPAPCSHSHRAVALDAATTTKPISDAVVTAALPISQMLPGVQPTDWPSAATTADALAPPLALTLSGVLRI